jgi:hypothetical protein
VNESKTRREGHEACMGGGGVFNAGKGLVGKPQGKKLITRTWQRWEAILQLTLSSRK